MSELEMHRHFGPLIGKIIMPDYIVKELNASCDEIRKNRKKLKKADLSKKLAGYVSSEFEIPHSLIKSQEGYWSSVLSDYVNIAFASVDVGMLRMKQNQPIELQNAWFNRYFPGDYQPSHFHPEATLSLTGFLKVPDWEKELSQAHKKKKGSTLPGQLLFSNGIPQEWSTHVHAVEPVVGEAYIFPATMLHSVYPYKTNGERRSFAMNFGPIYRGEK